MSTDGVGRSNVEKMFEHGYACAQAGRLSEAEEAFREALAATRGTGTAEEARACGNLASLFGVLGRRYEALLLYRRAKAIDDRLGARERVVQHLANMCAVYMTLRVWAFAGDALDDLDASVADDPKLAVEARRRTLWQRAYLALIGGNVEAARALHEELVPIYQGRTDPGVTMTLAEFECDLLLAEGEPADALEVIQAVRPTWEGAGPDVAKLLARRLQCLMALGRIEEHSALAHELPVRLPELMQGDPVSEFFVESTTDLARHLAPYEDLREEARMLYAASATAEIRRIHALENRLDDLPELAASQREDRTLLRAMKRAYATRQRELGAAVVALIRREGRSLAEFLFGEDAAAQVILCAWCGRVSSGAGRWFPSAIDAAAVSDELVTHGICRDCYAEEYPVPEQPL